MTCIDLLVMINVSHPSMSNTKFSDNTLSEIMAVFIIRKYSRFNQKPVKKSEFWELPSTIWTSGTHFPEGGAV